MAKLKNLIVDQGSTFKHDESYVNAVGPIDLTDHTLYAQIRKSPTSTTSVTLTAAITNATAGAYSLSLTDEESLTLKPGRYVYDVLIENLSGERTRILEGIVTVTPAVTKI